MPIVSHLKRKESREGGREQRRGEGRGGEGMGGEGRRVEEKERPSKQVGNLLAILKSLPHADLSTLVEESFSLVQE